MYEVELRALIRSDKLKTIKEILEKESSEKSFIKRFNMVYTNSEDMVPDEESPNDLRIRITPNKSQIIFKYGNWHGSAVREESEIEFNKDNLKDLLQMFYRMDYKWGIISYQNRNQYKYKEFTITIDKYDDIDDSVIEVELVIENESETKDAADKIRRLLESWELKVLESEGMTKFVKEFNQRKKWQFNFKNESVSEFVTKWKDWIELKA